MRKTGHQLTGIAAGLLATSPADPLQLITVFVAGWAGGMAPDLLEVPVGSRRLIPHRRVTHWTLGWAGCFLFSGMLYRERPWDIVLATGLAFCAGALSHCLADLPNPHGVPLLHPWERTSLKWWPSGRHDYKISLALLVLAVWSILPAL